MTPDQLREHGLPMLSGSTLERLIYVAGPARGGTSIVSKALGQHPQIMGIWDDYHFVDQVWPYRHKVHDRLWRILVLLPQFCDLDAVATRLDADQHRLLVEYVNQVIQDKQYKSLFSLYPLLYAAHFSESTDPNTFTSWLVKDNTWRDLDTISQQFPQSRFVFVLRDPRSSVLSIARRAANRDLSTCSAQLSMGDIVQGSLYWMTLTEKCLQIARRHPERALVMSFESFLQQPESTLNDAFEFAVGERLPLDEMAKLVNELEGGATNNPAEHYQGVSQAPLARWQSELPAEAMEIISEIAGITARKVGYDVPPPKKRRGLIELSRQVSDRRDRIVAAVKLGYFQMTGRPLAR
jgi:hypothetical protein